MTRCSLWGLFGLSFRGFIVDAQVGLKRAKSCVAKRGALGKSGKYQCGRESMLRLWPASERKRQERKKACLRKVGRPK